MNAKREDLTEALVLSEFAKATLVDRLRWYSSRPAEDEIPSDVRDILNEAADRIEYLESVAGVVCDTAPIGLYANRQRDGEPIDNIPVPLEERRIKVLEKLKNHDKSLFTQGQLNYLFHKLKDQEAPNNKVRAGDG